MLSRLKIWLQSDRTSCALTSFVSALEFTQISSNENDVLGWTGGAQVDQPVVFPGPTTEPWVSNEDIPTTLERMCRYNCRTTSGDLFWTSNIEKKSGIQLRP